MKRKEKRESMAARACQLRGNGGYGMETLRGFAPIGSGEARLYQRLREAIPVLDAAVGKLVRLSGGFSVGCKNETAQRRLEAFLKNVPCGYGQVGIDSFLYSYMDSLLTYGRAIGEILVGDGRVQGLCWGDVNDIQIRQGGSPMEVELWGPDSAGRLRPLPYPHLLLFAALNPEPKNPYGVSMFRGMPFLADILMKIYASIGLNWERAGNVRYSVICKNGNELDPATAQERGNQIAQEWARAMEDGKNGMVRDFVAVGDVEIKVIGGEAPILDSQVPVRQILEQLVAKTGLPPFLLGLNWSTTERMSAQQVDILTSELWALRRTVEPMLRKVCRMFLALEGLDDRVEILWEDISLQDLAEQAQAELYRAQAERLRQEG